MLTFGVIEHDQCCATLVGAQMQFCFADFDSETSTCQGNLLGTVNSAEDCCQPIPWGLGGGGYVAAGSEGCMSCTRFIGKVLSRCMHILGKPEQAPCTQVSGMVDFCLFFSLNKISDIYIYSI